MLLLNTDLHVAELSTHMSRNQFVRNTLSAIQMQLHPNGSNSDFDSSSGRQGSDHTGSTPARRIKRSDSITSWNSLSRDTVNGLSQHLSPQVNDSTASFQVANNDLKEGSGATVLYDRNWENEMETLLKVGQIAMRLLVPRLNESVGNVCGHQKSTGAATTGYFRAVIHFFPLATRDVIAQSQHSRATRSPDGVQERQHQRIEFHPRSSQWCQSL
jgi:hypothetical protein